MLSLLFNVISLPFHCDHVKRRLRKLRQRQSKQKRKKKYRELNKPINCHEKTFMSRKCENGSKEN